ncbi:MAG TPA: hypothetical protein VG819_02180 [Rhizomicrobium sp.]|nr:hypothetical protein [Rhizomicrobium sp.]
MRPRSGRHALQNVTDFQKYFFDAAMLSRGGRGGRRLTHTGFGAKYSQARLGRGTSRMR